MQPGHFTWINIGDFVDVTASFVVTIQSNKTFSVHMRLERVILLGTANNLGGLNDQARRCPLLDHSQTLTPITVKQAALQVAEEPLLIDDFDHIEPNPNALMQINPPAEHV